MAYFLIVYDQRTGEILEFEEFADASREKALAMRFSREREHRESSSVEVVLLTSESEDHLRRTHSRYFKTAGELAESGGTKGGKG